MVRCTWNSIPACSSSWKSLTDWFQRSAKTFLLHLTSNNRWLTRLQSYTVGLTNAIKYINLFYKIWLKWCNSAVPWHFNLATPHQSHRSLTIKSTIEQHDLTLLPPIPFLVCCDMLDMYMVRQEKVLLRELQLDGNEDLSLRNLLRLFTILGRPTQSSTDLGFTAILSSIFFLFVSYPPSSLNGTQPKPATRSEVIAIWKCMSEIWSMPSPKNRGPKNRLFRRLRNLAANLTTHIFRTKHDIHSASATRDFLHRLKMSWTLVHKRLKIGP